MNAILPALLGILQPPYSWILLLIIALPYWILYLGVFLYRVEIPVDQRDRLPYRIVTKDTVAKADLTRYAALLTAVWLLLVAFKAYQQYFAASPLPYTELSVFDFSLGLFCLASWAGIVLLEAQDRV